MIVMRIYRLSIVRFLWKTSEISALKCVFVFIPSLVVGEGVSTFYRQRKLRQEIGFDQFKTQVYEQLTKKDRSSPFHPSCQPGSKWMCAGLCTRTAPSPASWSLDLSPPPLSQRFGAGGRSEDLGGFPRSQAQSVGVNSQFLVLLLYFSWAEGWEKGEAESTSRVKSFQQQKAGKLHRHKEGVEN